MEVQAAEPEVVPSENLRDGGSRVTGPDLQSELRLKAARRVLGIRVDVYPEVQADVDCLDLAALPGVTIYEADLVQAVDHQGPDPTVHRELDVLPGLVVAVERDLRG